VGFEKRVKEVNGDIDRWWNQMNIEMMNNDNITEVNLSPKKLHLDKGGNSKLAENLIKFLRGIN